MPTTLTKPGAGLAPVLRPARTSPSHGHGRRWPLVVTGLVLGLLIALTAWTLVDRWTGPDERIAAPAVEAGWIDPLFAVRVIGLQQSLRDSGYSVPVTGVLDPVTRSAAADSLRLDAARPLEPWLAVALQGTVITGRRDPAAWNARFGADRATRMAERPLTGPGGQLDAYGNLTG